MTVGKDTACVWHVWSGAPTLNQCLNWWHHCHYTFPVIIVCSTMYLVCTSMYQYILNTLCNWSRFQMHLSLKEPEPEIAPVGVQCTPERWKLPCQSSVFQLQIQLPIAAAAIGAILKRPIESPTQSPVQNVCFWVDDTRLAPAHSSKPCTTSTRFQVTDSDSDNV